MLIPLAVALAAAAPGAWAKAPAGATGECKDGSYTSAAQKEGACSSHGGVKKWLAKEDKASKSSKVDKAARSESPSDTATRVDRPKVAATTNATRHGGAGQVWVNTDSKVYHCSKDALYGKTKQGEYMSEPQAKAAGARPSRGKECS